MRGFTLPRPRSPGFGSYGCDSGPFRTPPLGRACGHVGFPTPPGLNPLGSPHPYTPRPVFRNGRHDPGIPLLVLLPRGSFLRRGYLKGRAILSPPGFRLFSPPARGAFQLSLTVLVRYRSRDVFRVGGLMSPSFPRDIQRTVLRDSPGSMLVTPTGLSPSMAPHSRGLRLPNMDPLWAALQLHISLPLREGIRFALCRFRSPLLPASRLISFPAGTRMFLFPAFPLPNGSAPNGAGSPIRGSRVLRLPAPPPGLSQLATPFLGARAEPSTRWGYGSVRCPDFTLRMGTYARLSSISSPSPTTLMSCGLHKKIIWWTRRDLNPRPPACKAGALPAELRAHILLRQAHDWFLVPCSNQLFSREVIQPQVPLRLPCYDFAPLAGPRFDPPLNGMGLTWTRLGWRDGRCVQGAGTHSPRHGEARLLRIPASRGRVTALDPN